MRCRACDKILTQAEMFTREVMVESTIIEIMEDMCTVCRSTTLNIYEEDLSDLALYYIEEDRYNNENY